jgi:hypothetical protein
MKTKVLAIMLVAISIIVLIAAGCYAILNPKTVSPNEYVFVEHYVETQGYLADNPEVSAYVYMGYPAYNATTSQALLKAV